MKDATLPFQSAVIRALKANSDVSAIVGQRVYPDRAPPRQPNQPGVDYISMGPTQAIPFDSQRNRGASVFLQIDSWAEAPEDAAEQKILALKMNAAVIAALWGDIMEAPEGWRLHDVRTDGNVQVISEQDGVTSHGVVTIRGDLTPL